MGNFIHPWKTARSWHLLILHNNLLGQLPMWLGTSNPNLVVLNLRSNHLYGSMPSHLCHLAHLQLLDLALNQISGRIPKCLNNLTLLTQKLSSNATITHLYEEDFSRTSKDRAYDDHVFWMWKGREYEYKGILGLVKNIDLSSNKLTGTIPLWISLRTFSLDKSVQILVLYFR